MSNNLAVPKTPRLTMILSGAISLGAYEAGVVSQIAYALAKWNEGESQPRMIIDVIAGASAGAMTGAMLARHIMTGSDPARFVKLNYEQWYGTGFGNLLPRNDDTKHSFLSAKVIDNEARALYNDIQPDPYMQRVRQEELIYTCTLTSLDPIPFQFRFTTGQTDGDEPVEDQMWGKTQRDFITFSLTNDSDEPIKEVTPTAERDSEQAHPADWDRLFSVAVASGAFPLAWQPIKLHRLNEDYPPPWGELGPGTCTQLRYTDGGVLNNMPLGQAANAMRALRGTVSAMEDRVYILIEPDPERVTPSGTREVYDSSKSAGVRDEDTPLLGVLDEVYHALREQSFMMDVLESQKVNRRIEARNKFLLNLIADATNALEEASASLREDETRQQLAGFLGKRVSQHTVDAVLTQYHDQTIQDKALQDALASIRPERKNLFLLQVALSDFIADLHLKGTIRIERIFPAPSARLAGAMIGHFGGFLDPLRMRHDFLRGAEDAFVWLTRLADYRDWPTPQRIVNDPDVVREVPGMKSLSPEEEKKALRAWHEISRKDREALSDQVLERMERLVGDEINAGGVGRLMLRVLRKSLDEFIRYED
jgi:predicted acylesterase/phospholipase RssA